MESNKKIQIYSSFFLGHTIPLAKIASILKKKNKDYEITIFTTEVAQKKLEKQYGNVKFVGLNPQITPLRQRQLLRSRQQLFKTLFTMFDSYLQTKKDLPDLIITDFFAVGPMNYAKKNNVKLIVNIPNSYESIPSFLNFITLNRSVNIEGMLINYSLPKHPMLAIFDEVLDSFRGVGRVIYHSFIGLDQPTIMPSNHSLIGILPNNSTLKIPNDLKQWIDGWKAKGRLKFLYVSFGSILVLSQKFALKLAEIFSQIGYPVIWSLRSPARSKITNNLIYHQEWLPQLPILELPQVRGYMTHCGWGSITEALTTLTPLLGVPIFADQTFNANLVVRRHLGVKICDSNILIPPLELELDFDNQTIKNVVKQLIENQTYLDSVKKLNKMSKFHKTEELIYQIVEETLQFGNSHLICDKYEQATIKTDATLSKIFKQEYVPRTQTQFPQ